MMWMMLTLTSFQFSITAAGRIDRRVKHPGLLLNQEEIAQLKTKIRDCEWASHLFEKAKAMAEKGSVREMAIYYAITGEERYSDSVRQRLVSNAQYSLPRYEQLDLKNQPEYGAWSEWGTWAWAYDLTYDTFLKEEHQLVQRWLRVGCKTVIEGERLWTTTPNLVFGKHFNVGLVGYCLGDEELIEWALNDPGEHGPERGGFYQVLDTMIKDTHFWGETPIYALHYDLHGMLALAEAALHYDGTDLYNYVSKKSGASIKSIIDGYLRLGYPLEQTGIGKGSIRMATYGDGSTSYTPSGALLETFLVNSVDPSPSVPVLAGELEIAYKRYKAPEYAWILSLNPNRDTYVNYGRAAWGYTALTHGVSLPEELPPPKAPSGIYPSQGFAFLRSDESPDYWTSGAISALIMQGKSIGHGHNDYYSLIFHGKGRLLYPDLNVIQYEPTYLNWTREGIAHNTLLVDHQSPQPGPFKTKHDFNNDVKFFSITGTAFKGVAQTRNLLLTKEYLLDVFYAFDIHGNERTFDWVLHGLGQLYPGNPAAYRATDALVPFYWWIDNEMGREVNATWQMDWIQRTAGVTEGLQSFGEEWFEQENGVRMTMLGSKGNQVFYGDGPITDGPPYHRIDGAPEGSAPMVVARRKATSTSFSAVHEPYKGKPQIQEVQRLAEIEKAIAIRLKAESFTDYVLVAFDDEEHTLVSDDDEVFTFSDYGYLRFSEGQVVAQGKLKGFRLKLLDAKSTGKVNEKNVMLQHENAFIIWGNIPEDVANSPTGGVNDDPIEQAAWLHYSFLPEEICLSTTGDNNEKEIEMHPRCVGNGEVKGRLKLITPEELNVEPQEIYIQSLSEGDEQIVRIKIRTTEKAQNELYEIQFVPVDGLRAAIQTLSVSVGIVITTDRRIPKNAQFVIRAPGYKMKVDQYSGVSYYLLDGDGYRRHGRMHNTNFIFGIPAVMRDEKWTFCFRHPCRFIWKGENTLTVGCDGTYGDHDARMLYTFYEDRIVIAMVPPTDATKEHTMWLGNFDALGAPKHNGEEVSDNRIIADWFFFPHPVYRQGLLLLPPKQTKLQLVGTAMNFPIKTGEEAVLRFVEENQMSQYVK